MDLWSLPQTNLYTTCKYILCFKFILFNILLWVINQRMREKDSWHARMQHRVRHPTSGYCNLFTLWKFNIHTVITLLSIVRWVYWRERDHRRGEEGRVAQNKPKQQLVTRASTRHTTYMDAFDVFPTDPSKSVFEARGGGGPDEDFCKWIEVTPGINSTERRSTSKL